MGKKQFKAESKRLLDLMINSIYTNKEIFLREIISNASDAIDKLCYLSLTDDKVGLSRSDYHIDIIVDKNERTITGRDNGIGMTQEEAENNLGVIAKSGSYKFKSELDTEQAEGEVPAVIEHDFPGGRMVDHYFVTPSPAFWEDEGVQSLDGVSGILFLQQPDGAPWKILVHEPSMIKEVVFDFPEEEFRKMLADNAMVLPGEPGFTPITD